MYIFISCFADVRNNFYIIVHKFIHKAIEIKYLPMSGKKIISFYEIQYKIV